MALTMLRHIADTDIAGLAPDDATAFLSNLRWNAIETLAAVDEDQ